MGRHTLPQYSHMTEQNEDSPAPNMVADTRHMYNDLAVNLGTSGRRVAPRLHSRFREDHSTASATETSMEKDAMAKAKIGTRAML